MFLFSVVNTLKTLEKEMSGIDVDWDHSVFRDDFGYCLQRRNKICLVSVGFWAGDLEMGAVNNNITY